MRRITTSLAVAITAVVLTMQSLNGKAQEGWPEPVSTWIGELWEHKVEIIWQMNAISSPENIDDAIVDLMKGELLDTQLWLTWRQNGLPPHIRQVVNDLATQACGFYGREAWGPLNEAVDNDVLRVTETFACAIR